MALSLPATTAQRTWQELQSGVDQAVAQLTPQARAQRVYVEVSPAPYGASESSFIGENLMRMGVSNILPAAMGPFPKVNPEFVVRAQPDAIIAGDSSRQSMLMRPGWSQLRALREERVCVFAQEQADILVRAGPRMAEGARLIVDCLNRAAAKASKGRG
jgi:iron complex transport system substrate-binding protein